ncbi:hypothetical protein ACLOJK_037553 [Asimina triloba]
MRCKLERENRHYDGGISVRCKLERENRHYDGGNSVRCKLERENLDYDSENSNSPLVALSIAHLKPRWDWFEQDATRMKDRLSVPLAKTLPLAETLGKIPRGYRKIFLIRALHRIGVYTMISFQSNELLSPATDVAEESTAVRPGGGSDGPATPADSEKPAPRPTGRWWSGTQYTSALAADLVCLRGDKVHVFCHVKDLSYLAALGEENFSRENQYVRENQDATNGFSGSATRLISSVTAKVCLFDVSNPLPFSVSHIAICCYYRRVERDESGEKLAWEGRHLGPTIHLQPMPPYPTLSFVKPMPNACGCGGVDGATLAISFVVVLCSSFRSYYACQILHVSYVEMVENASQLSSISFVLVIKSQGPPA